MSALALLAILMGATSGIGGVLTGLGYRYVDETDNPVYRLFLR